VQLIKHDDIRHHPLAEFQDRFGWLRCEDAPGYRRPYCQVLETGDSYQLDIYLPGVDRQQTVVSVQQNIPRIEAPRLDNVRERRHVLHREITEGGFRLRLHLNFEVESREVQAVFRNGVPRASLPLVEPVRSHTVAIELKGALERRHRRPLGRRRPHSRITLI